VNRHLRRAAAALFVVCAALFVIGVIAEGDSHNEASEAAEQTGANEAAGHDEFAEADDGAEAGAHDEAAKAAEREAAEDAGADDAAVGGEAGDDERAQPEPDRQGVGFAVLFAVFDIATTAGLAARPVRDSSSWWLISATRRRSRRPAPPRSRWRP